MYSLVPDMKTTWLFILFIHKWLLTLCPFSSERPVLSDGLLDGSWNTRKYLKTGKQSSLWMTVMSIYLPPWPGLCWPFGHWTSLGFQPCSHTPQYHSTERSGWSGTHFHLSPHTAAGTWGTAWKTQPHPWRRGWYWSIWTVAPVLVPSRNSGRRKFGRHTYRAKSHCPPRSQWLLRCWKTLWRTLMTLNKLVDNRLQFWNVTPTNAPTILYTYHHFYTHMHFTNARKQKSTEYRPTLGQDWEEKITKTTHLCRLLYNNVLKWGWDEFLS